MPIPGEVQNFNGTHGEDLTQAIIGKRFWYLRRSVDIEGADFLVQPRVGKIDNLPSRQVDIFVFGIVQAKFFQSGTTVSINQEYVLNREGKPIKEFFLMCHTHDSLEDTHTYFFTAEDIQRSFKYNEEKRQFQFRVTVPDAYAAYKDIPHRMILDAIEKGIKEAKEKKNLEYVNRLFFYQIEASRSYGARHIYLLRNVAGVGVVIRENTDTGSKQLLEPRRDVYENFGGYQWGYKGTGPQFLASCLLTHHFDGRTPTSTEIKILVNWVLSALTMGENWDIPSEVIDAPLQGKMLSVSELCNLCAPSADFEERQIKHPRQTTQEFIEKIEKRRAGTHIY